MDEPIPFYRDPKRQIMLVIIITGILYILTFVPQGVAQGIVTGEGYIYTVVGSRGGLRVVNTQNPAHPSEVGFYDTRGTAKGLARSGNTVFVADGSRGMTIIDVSDPTNPRGLGVQETLGDTQDVAVASNYAYLASGEAGVWIVDVSDPRNPELKGVIDTPGNAQGIDIVEVFAPASTEGSESTETSPTTTVWVTFVYVADGKYGVQIIEVLDPRMPAIVGNYPTEGEAKDVNVVGPYAYIAEEKAGMEVINVTDPLNISQLGTVDTPGTALSIDVIGNTAYVADKERGMSIVDVTNPAAPILLSSLDSSGVAYDIAASGAVAYVADGKAGIKVIDVSKSGAPKQIGSYDTPGGLSIGQVYNSIKAVLTGQSIAAQGKTLKSLIIILVDIFVFFTILVFWLGFYSQFVLPVRTIAERRKVIDRMVGYHLGARGPAISIENGIVKEREKEEFRPGPGVALLDSASGAIFRNAHAFIQPPAGPGVFFTREHEYLAGQVDLHIQTQSLGPLDEKEDPFKEKDPTTEPEDAYLERQKRRTETSGLTRDGVEIVPRIIATFGLISEPGSGRTQFGFNPESVWNAIAREGIDPDPSKTPDRRLVSWDWLPVRLAADLWREYLRKFILDELFNFPEAHEQSDPSLERQTAFDRIVEMVNIRLSRPEAPELNEVGLPTGEKKPSREFDILQIRGIRVERIRITNLKFPKDVEDKLVDQWQATWLHRAQEESEFIERLHTRMETKGTEKAITDFAQSSSQKLGKDLLMKPDPSSSIGLRDSLEELVRGTLRLCNLDQELRQRLTNQPGALLEMIDWLRKQ